MELTRRRLSLVLLAVALGLWLGLLLSLLLPGKVRAEEPQTGTASWFGPGNGVATQWCTWVLRHSEGCGFLAIQSHETGITVTAPIVDWCQCYRGTSDERIVDLQWGVLLALGLTKEQGLYPVTTWRVATTLTPISSGLALPNTAMEAP